MASKAPDYMLRGLICYFRSQEASENFGRTSYGSSGSFWFDLGWDTVSGPGDASNYARSYVESYIESLPKSIIYLLWWNTCGSGQNEKLELHLLSNMEELEQFRITSEKAIEGLVDHFYRKIRIQAEQFYCAND